MENGKNKKSTPGTQGSEGFDILLVEDHAQLVDATREVLEALGQQVRVAASGERAIAEARRRPPDCVLVDLRLPDMSGYDLGFHLRTKMQLWRAALVALTADASLSPDVSRLDDVFDLVLTKPLDPLKLVQWLSSRATRDSSH